MTAHLVVILSAAKNPRREGKTLATSPEGLVPAMLMVAFFDPSMKLLHLKKKDTS
jgi:hypothetical protein